MSLDIDLDARLGGVEEGASAVFDVTWAREVIAEAVKRMQVDCDRSGRSDIWAVFECRVLSPILDGVAPPAYEEVVKRFGFASSTQASNVLITGKRMFCRTLRSIVGEYARDEKAIDQEISDLREILATAGA